MQNRVALLEAVVFTLVAVVCLSSAVFAAPEKPLVGTKLRITASLYKDNLGNTLPDLETGFAADIASLGNDELSFLEWRPLSQIKNPSRLAAILEVILQVGDGSDPKARNVFLRFLVTDSAGTYVCGTEQLERRSWVVLTEPLYIGTRGGPTGNKNNRLEKDVRSKLSEVFGDETKRRKLTSKILICREAGQLPGWKAIAIGLNQDAACIDGGSKLRIALCPTISGTAGQAGAILKVTVIDRQAKRFDGKWGDLIQATVDTFQFRGPVRPDWQPDIPRVLEERKVGSVGVSVEDFIKISDPGDSLAPLDPRRTCP